MLLFDENLSYKLVSKLLHEFPHSQAVVRVKGLGEGASDEHVWKYAKENHLVLTTKDKDFVDYWKRFGPPPKIIKLNVGNCRINAIELLLKRNKDRIALFVAGNNGLLVLDGE
jgi:predicted nuclease of predicted toxin-antitoxin system